MAFFVLRISFFKHAQSSRKARCLIFRRTLRLLPYFMCANSEALARLRGCAGLPEPSLVAYVISTIISWAGSKGIGGSTKMWKNNSSLKPICGIVFCVRTFWVLCLDLVTPVFWILCFMFGLYCLGLAHYGGRVWIIVSIRNPDTKK